MKSRHFKILLFSIMISFSAYPQGSAPMLITNIPGRETINLNGGWQIIIDPYENGFYNYRYQEHDGGFFRNAKPQSKSDLIEYDFDAAPTLSVPGDWNTQREDLFFYEGTIWYKKSIDYSPKPNQRVFVYFGAANYHAIVYVNGKKIGEHTGGFTPFNFELSDILTEGDNFIIVKVDNQRYREGVPTVNTDWWNYGGLTRPVHLVEVPQTFIQDYFIQLEKGSQKTIGGWVQLNGGQQAQTVKVHIPETGISHTLRTDSSGYGEFSFSADLTLWSPENPKLYDVVVESETDGIDDRIGFRTIETRGADILLNGKSIFLRGICLHEEAPIRTGRAFSREDAAIALGWAKELNCNFLRLAHYPHNEAIVRLADELGFLLWSEIPVYWTILWENTETFDNAAQQLRENIIRDKNRASIIMWSMANETPLSNARLTFLKKLTTITRQMDPTRLVTAALEGHYIDDNTQMIDDPFGEFIDVIGRNEYLGWYDGLPEKASIVTLKTIYDKPLIISEFGAGALYNFHGDALTRWTEEYQESVYKNQLEFLKKIPTLRGTAPWILTDFRSPRRPLAGIQDWWNRKGLISDRGEKKKAFYVMQKYYQEIKSQHK